MPTTPTSGYRYPHQDTIDCRCPQCTAWRTQHTLRQPARRGIVMMQQYTDPDPRQVRLLAPCQVHVACWLVTPIGVPVAEGHAAEWELVGACTKCGTFHDVQPYDVVACAEAQEADYQLDQAAARAERLADEAGL